MVECTDQFQEPGAVIDRYETLYSNLKYQFESIDMYEKKLKIQRAELNAYLDVCIFFFIFTCNNLLL